MSCLYPCLNPLRWPELWLHVHPCPCLIPVENLGSHRIWGIQWGERRVHHLPLIVVAQLLLGRFWRGTLSGSYALAHPLLDQHGGYLPWIQGRWRKNCRKATIWYAGGIIVIQGGYPHLAGQSAEVLWFLCLRFPNLSLPWWHHWHSKGVVHDHTMHCRHCPTDPETWMPTMLA